MLSKNWPGRRTKAHGQWRSTAAAASAIITLVCQVLTCELHAADTPVRPNIVVVLVDDEATVKRFYPEGDRIRLQPSNPGMEPIYVHRDDFRSTSVLGVVVGMYRQMG